jgi:hypothetical protein
MSKYVVKDENGKRVSYDRVLTQAKGFAARYTDDIIDVNPENDSIFLDIIKKTGWTADNIDDPNYPRIFEYHA